MPPTPGTPMQRKAYRKFVNQRGFRYHQKGRGSDAWHEDRVAHFEWWRHNREGPQPHVNWERAPTGVPSQLEQPQKRQKLLPSSSSSSSHSASLSVIDRESKEVSQEHTHTSLHKTKQIQRSIEEKDGVITTRELETEVTQAQIFQHKLTAKIEHAKELHIKEQMDQRSKLVEHYATGEFVRMNEDRVQYIRQNPLHCDLKVSCTVLLQKEMDNFTKAWDKLDKEFAKEYRVQKGVQTNVLKLVNVKKVVDQLTNADAPIAKRVLDCVLKVMTKYYFDKAVTDLELEMDPVFITTSGFKKMIIPPSSNAKPYEHRGVKVTGRHYATPQRNITGPPQVGKELLDDCKKEAEKEISHFFVEVDMKGLSYAEKDNAHTKRSRELLDELITEGPAKCKNLAGAILQSLLTRKMLLQSLSPEDAEMPVRLAGQLVPIPSQLVALGHCGFVQEDYANAYVGPVPVEVASVGIYIPGLGYVPTQLEAPMMFEQLPKAVQATSRAYRTSIESELQLLTYENIKSLLHNHWMAPPSMHIKDYRALMGLKGTSTAMDAIFNELIPQNPQNDYEGTVSDRELQMFQRQRAGFLDPRLLAP